MPTFGLQSFAVEGALAGAGRFGGGLGGSGPSCGGIDGDVDVYIGPCHVTGCDSFSPNPDWDPAAEDIGSLATMAAEVVEIFPWMSEAEAYCELLGCAITKVDQELNDAYATNPKGYDTYEKTRMGDRYKDWSLQSAKDCPAEPKIHFDIGDDCDPGPDGPTGLGDMRRKAGRSA